MLLLNRRLTPLRLFYRYFFFPIAKLVLRGLAMFDSKVYTGLQARRQKEGVLPWLAFPPQTAPIWLHCSSMEIEYAKPILRKIKQTYPQQKILLTYFSPSVERVLAKIPEIDMYCPMPWDEAKYWTEFLAHHNPQALLIARTDLWPEMLYQTRASGIPSLLFSASLTSNSNRLSFWGRPLATWTARMLTNIQCVTEEDLANFSRLGVASRTQVCGDSRYDQVLHRLRDQAQPLKMQLKPAPNDFVFIGGSTWPEDEEAILNGFKKALEGNPKIKLILVPHEPTPEHIKSLRSKMNQMDLTHQLYSLTEKWTAPILLIDKMGILAELYTWAKVALVGGSFKKTVHSVMEPLAAGCVTLVGPYHENNREALAFAKLSLLHKINSEPVVRMVTPVADSSELASLLLALSQTPPDTLREIARAIQEEIGKKLGATVAVMTWLETHLKQNQKNLH